MGEPIQVGELLQQVGDCYRVLELLQLLELIYIYIYTYIYIYIYIVGGVLEQEQQVLITVVKNDKTRAGGAFFPVLNNAIYDLSKYGVFKTVDRNDYKHNCLYLALQAGGLSDIKLQELILTLRNRTTHKCDLSNA